MYRQTIHPRGPLFSRIVAGAWRWHNVSPEIVERLIHTSLDVGITTFDHADIYGDHSNEEVFGRVLKRDPNLRDQMELVTKCGIKFASEKRPGVQVKHYDTSREHILWSVDNSLSQLGTEYIDLLLIHRPDPLLDPIEVADTFFELRESGKVLHFGVSNFTPGQFRMLQHYLHFPIVTNQIEISLSRIDPLFNGDLDVLMEHEASPMGWSPLGGGNLVIADRDLFGKASKYNASYSQLSLAWLMRHPAQIFPVIGTTKPERIIECAKSIDLKLDRQDWFEMLKWITGKDVA